jgi:AcrR family transcriptional regulator
MSKGEATRDRILSAAMKLFAAEGYAQTSVGAIEQGAGLAPRSGALYQYFEGKEDVLRQAVDRELAHLDSLQQALDMLPLGDLKAELTFLARWNLSSLEQRSDLLGFLRRDAAGFPELAQEIHERMTAKPLEQVAGWIDRLAADAGAEPFDSQALALIMVESLSAYWLMRQGPGRVPGDLNNERFISTWVDLGLTYARAKGIIAEVTGPTRRRSSGR